MNTLDCAEKPVSRWDGQPRIDAGKSQLADREPDGNDHDRDHHIPEIKAQAFGATLRTSLGSAIQRR